MVAGKVIVNFKILTFRMRFKTKPNYDSCSLGQRRFTDIGLS